MKNVTIGVKANLTVGEKSIRLNNGNLVLQYDGNDNCIGAFIVTSFRDQKETCKDKIPISSYCSLVNLDTGYLEFEERCSRTTTVARVLSHLNPSDYKAEKALKDGQYLKVYNVGDYNIDITLLREQV